MWSKPNGGTLEDFRAQVRYPSSGGQPDFIGGDLKVMGAKVLLLGRKRKAGSVEQKMRCNFGLYRQLCFSSLFGALHYQLVPSQLERVFCR